MMNDRNDRGLVGSALNLGARNAQRPKTKSLRMEQLAVTDLAHKARDESGSDPYNTSGSFDRTKNWSRVGRR